MRSFRNFIEKMLCRHKFIWVGVVRGRYEGHEVKARKYYCVKCGRVKYKEF